MNWITKKVVQKSYTSFAMSTKTTLLGISIKYSLSRASIVDEERGSDDNTIALIITIFEILLQHFSVNISLNNLLIKNKIIVN
jgi:hypothetical protein